MPYAGAKNCTGYDTSPYGLKGRTGYATALTDEQITQQLVTRSVTYLLGEADVLPLGIFDTSCPDVAVEGHQQGMRDFPDLNRIARVSGGVFKVDSTIGARQLFYKRTGEEYSGLEKHGPLLAFSWSPIHR